MGKSGRNLKTALKSQQSRLKAKEKLSHAAQVSEQKSRKHHSGTGSAGDTGPQNISGKPDRKRKKKAGHAPVRPPTIPFTPTNRILLIGEGNFSYARALIQDPPPRLGFLPPGNITATAYDTEAECYEKYPEAADHVTYLRDKGVQVLFGVDGTKLEKHANLKGKQWDRIVWNFPHAGKGIADQDRNILSNQVLILGFLRSAAKMLVRGPVPDYMSSKKKKKKGGEDASDEGESDMCDQEDMDDEDMSPKTTQKPTRGTILITLRNVVPYTHWDVTRLAKNPPLPTSGSTPPNPKYTLLRSFTFHRDIWKGYEHRMTKGERAHGKGTTGEGGEDRTWEFCFRDEDRQ
ncbi:hypothetical protein CVT24_005311 [Panaeolus cyanescens]|uniref:25S rRNA (uridine-N(3))-methyltransferase BMT5-like domain-containing protein n=1 Tax=Panaeolus cyanescens TaxID=181874 RepID=A0A409Y9D9_9AGAR|nr:hypothetical protein CVT24_005311 [Panaeolus cyanescens]